jgi:hypothetical protein
MAEWMLVIIDTDLNNIALVYCQYPHGISKSTEESRQQLNKFIATRLQRILKESGSGLPNIAPNLPASEEPALYNRSSWTVSYQSPQSNQISTNYVYCRTPLGMNGRVASKEDSGLYIAYAIECDFYDAPIYAHQDYWSNIKRYFAYCILNSMLSHMM